MECPPTCLPAPAPQAPGCWAASPQAAAAIGRAAWPGWPAKPPITESPRDSLAQSSLLAQPLSVAHSTTATPFSPVSLAGFDEAFRVLQQFPIDDCARKGFVEGRRK